jgi:glycosyltransferase involved in cell wall biosynthesis
MPIRIAAKVDRADREYFESVVRPLLADPLVEFVGEIGEREKQDFLGNAFALLFPIDWPEPFGLVVIEAMAARPSSRFQAARCPS